MSTEKHKLVNGKKGRSIEIKNNSQSRNPTMDGETYGSPGNFSLSNGTHKEEEGRSLMSQNGNDEEDIASNKNGGETSEAKTSTSEPLQARSYETKPDAVLASDGKEDEKKAKSKSKRDRSKLRKGKWTVRHFVIL